MSNSATAHTTTRIVYVDLLRIFSIFCMIVLHVSASQYFNQPLTSAIWNISNIYNGFVRFCVPIFVMISGSLFLNPNKTFSINRLFTKNILRISTAFFFWSLLYAVFTMIVQDNTLNSNHLSGFITNVITGHYHFWFLFMLIGLYLCIPFLRLIVEDTKLTQYFLLLAFIFASVLPCLAQLPHFSLLNVLLDKMDLEFVMGYVGYFVAGYYLTITDFSKIKVRIIFLIGLIGILGSIVFTAYMSNLSGTPDLLLYDYLAPTCCVTAISVFMFFRTKISSIQFSPKQLLLITHVSKCSFGIYLVHVLFLFLYEQLGLVTTAFQPILSIPIISCIIFISSYAAVALIEKVPVLNKYIL